ncbi:phage Gp37/Gp68 family protein [Variovorax sp. PMC12]|uniref:phage Gp37/Gp68 family protein n=1 Tax=Variovorax sp. PMC12 TaxID=2126319 RepID=UPI000D135A81|nr:phage Gp37/Gp68 family protein [Variovorax sp. PMC12]AVQ81683.1 hypothetical protein C4F17_12385 [Variovorax sp. PMC12]
MAADSKIEWTDHTFNPWEGCQKVGPGCDHCYAESRNARFGGGQAINWGPGAPRRRTSESNWNLPKRWNAQADVFMIQHGRRQRVFCASLADVFDNAVDPQWRADLFELIAATPNLDWLLLTKRIGNVGNMLPVPFDFERLYPHVWIGATVVNQAEADRDIPKLQAVSAAKRFLSMEPLLGPVSFRWATWVDRPRMHRENGCEHHLDGMRGIDWVIVGGESGARARPMHPDWARSLRDQCQEAGVPFLFKQWGEWTAHDVDPNGASSHLCCIDRNGGECALSRGADMREKGEPWWHLPAHPGRGTWGPDGIPAGVVEVRRTGKKAAGRLLDGREWNGVPE